MRGLLAAGEPDDVQEPRRGGSSRFDSNGLKGFDRSQDSWSPLFYSTRPKAKGSGTVDEVTGIGVELPEKIVKVSPTTSVASVNNVEAGYASGWACHRFQSSSFAQNSAQIYAVVDGTIVASAVVAEIEKSPSPDIVETCSIGEEIPDILMFNISLPPLPQGIHELRVLLQNGKNETAFVEAFHSPLMFEESTIDPGLLSVIQRKDEIITHRNNLLNKLWNEINTQLPWKRYEKDAKEIPDELGSETPEHLAVILVRSDPSKGERRASVRKTWGASKAQEGSKVVVRFLIESQFAGPHKAALDKEMKTYDDILSLSLGTSRSSETNRLLFGLHQAVKQFDASFYLFADDAMLILPSRLQRYLSRKISEGNAYMGCMKSGDIVTEEGKGWYEPEHWRFGAGETKTYPQHARTHFFGFSRFVARHLARSREVLHSYSHLDTTIGTWMLGLDVNFDDNGDFCCDVDTCTTQNTCMALMNPGCDGICDTTKVMELWKRCEVAR
jgi:hypothetical protein